MARRKKTDAEATIYDTLHPWTWPLPFNSDEAVDLYLDDFMGQNNQANIKNAERREFMNALRSSLSLNHIEKRRVISNFSTLSRFQIDELMKVWSEERYKFIKLGKKHPQDIEKLYAKMELEWSFTLNSESGAEAFMSKYVYPKETKLPIDSLADAIKMLMPILATAEKYGVLVALVQELFERTKRLSSKTRQELINAGFHALTRSGRALTSKQLIRHPIGNELKKLSKKHKKDKAFLEFCSISYPMDIHGLVEDTIEVGKNLCKKYRKTYTRSSDLSSTLSTYFMLCSDFHKSLKAAEISIKQYDKEFSLDHQHILRLAEFGGGEDQLNTNILRNIARYYVLLDCFGGRKIDKRKDFIIDNFFKKPIENFNKWRPDKYISNLHNFIIIYFFSEDKSLQRNKGIIDYLSDKGDESENFLFNLAFSRPLRGGELDGLDKAMQSLKAKTDLLYFSLMVRAISISRLPAHKDRKFVCATIKTHYINTVEEKKWHLNKEDNILNQTYL